MKIKITLKDPDGVWDSIHRALGEPKDSDPVNDMLQNETVRKFVEYSEYVEIELDTDTGDARVVPVRE